MWTNSNKHALDIVKNICPHCNKELIMNKRAFANHVRWCKENPKHDEIVKSTSENVRKTLNSKTDEILGELKVFKVKCAKCGCEFEVTEREKKFPSKKKYYCSSSCRNSHKRTLESRIKTSESLKKWARERGLTPTADILKEEKVCPICGKVFHSRKIAQKTCCVKCANRLKSLNIFKKKFNGLTNDYERGKVLYSQYRKLCDFTFALSSFPDEFEFALIEENGWYKAKNHGNNLYGVSRDHLFSVNEGFKEHIDPYYISHPANCKLLLHSENSSKSDGCAITFGELKEKIAKWEEKYGVYENTINYKLLEEMGLYPLKT